MIPIESPFIEEISGMAIVKIVDQGQKMLMMLKLKFIRNKATLDIMNNTRETIIFDKKTSIGILDLRSLGYYKIKQGVLQQNLDKYYQFEEADKICADFNRIIERQRQEEKNDSKERYPWLEEDDERKYMTDKEILDKYINIKDSCLNKKERKQVMEMLYEYKDVFTLRDEIGMCPNIEVKIEVMDNLPFFIWPYHVKEEDRAVLDKEMRRLCTILNSLQSRKYCEVIMDDLLLFTPSKKAHMDKLEDLLKALRKNGLKISPKKCQLFRTELQYMGNTIFVKERRVCIKPLHSRLEAIQKMNAPTTAKQCKSFAGMVNFVSIFCPELQRLLKPIYDLTRKGRQLVWEKSNKMHLKK